MSFRPLRRRTVRWRPVAGTGLEHLTVAREGQDIVARGVIIGDRDAAPYGVDYTIVCDRNWAVRHLDLGTAAGMAISVSSDGAGAWTNHDGRPLPEFDGCLDVDLAGSAFTNTLPIRRLDWSGAAGPVRLRVLYVPFDSFVPSTDGQVYAALDERRFRFGAADRSFAAELPVDADGLVVDYPTLFERVKEH